MLSLLLALSLSAAPLDGGAPADPDTDAIKDVVSRFREGVEASDPSRVKELFWADAVVFLDGAPSASARDFLEVQLPVRLKKHKLKWLSEQNTGRAENGLAYVAQAAQVEDGSKKTTHALTFVLRKREGAWRIQHLSWASAR